MEDENNTSLQQNLVQKDKSNETLTTSTGRLRSRYLSKEEASKKTTFPRKSSEQSYSTTVPFHTAVELQVFKNFVKNFAATRECKKYAHTYAKITFKHLCRILVKNQEMLSIIIHVCFNLFFSKS